MNTLINIFHYYPVLTLIIYAKCRDGIILISDRQASNGEGEKKIVNKIYSSSNKKLILAFAGDGLRIENIYSTFDADPHLKDGDVINIMKSILSSSATGRLEDVEGVIMLKSGTKYQVYQVSSFGKIVDIIPLRSSFECFGLRAGKTVASVIAQNGDIENKKLAKATDFLISSMGFISTNFHGIGTLREGFDILSISERGDIFECPRFTKKNGGKISLTFKPSSKNVLNAFSITLNKSKRKRVKIKAKVKKTKKKIATLVPTVSMPTSLIYQPHSTYADIAGITDQARLSALQQIAGVAGIVDPSKVTALQHNLASIAGITDQARLLALQQIAGVAGIVDPSKVTCIQCGKPFEVHDSPDPQGKCATCRLSKV